MFSLESRLAALVFYPLFIVSYLRSELYLASEVFQREERKNLKERFTDNGDVQAFFENAGFLINDKINLFDMKDALLGPAQTGATTDQLRAMLETRVIYSLRVA